MTLAFIGEVEDPISFTKIRDEISFTPFTMTLSYLSYFPDRKNSKLYWLGIDPCEEVIDLQKRLTDLLKVNHLPFHDKPFLPHISLSRKTLRDSPLIIDDLLPITVKIDTLYLMESIPYKNTRIGIPIK